MVNPHRQNMISGGKLYAVDVDALETARRHSLHQKDVGATTITSFGHAAPTSSATTSSADDADAPWYSQTANDHVNGRRFNGLQRVLK